MSDVIVISVDDLTYWAGPNSIFSGQIKAPNIQRLAAEGVSFSNAYTPEAICNAARASFWSGLTPDQTSIHSNDQVWYETIDPSTTLSARFLQAGYDVGGYGKLTHSFLLPTSVSSQMYSDFGGKVGFDGTSIVGPLPPGVTEQQMSDHITIDKAIGFLRGHNPSDPFMLNVGLVKPHLNWVVPQEYFDLYPLDEIEVPGLVGDDMSNVPAFIRDQLVDSRGHAVPGSILEAKKFLQGYFASLTYADAQIGRLFDELDATGRWDTTSIVLWSDHG
ncbi:MAG: sulfatase-like hydrolase/transferase, partial [Paracoccaceae bacterium]